MRTRRSVQLQFFTKVFEWSQINRVRVSSCKKRSGVDENTSSCAYAHHSGGHIRANSYVASAPGDVYKHVLSKLAWREWLQVPQCLSRQQETYFTVPKF